MDIAYIKIDGIKGECKLKEHKDEIEVFDFHVTAFNGNSSLYGTGSASGRTTASELTFHKRVDSASTSLHLLMGTNAPKTDIYLSMSKGTGSEANEIFYRQHFTDCCIHSLTTTLDAGAHGHPLEQVIFSFKKVRIEYAQQDEKGKLGPWMSVTHDIEKGTTT